MTTASPAIPAARDDRWLALAVLCAGTLMIVLDATIVNVALPAIQREFGFSQSSLAWVVNAYLIAFGGVLLLAGRLGDLLGRGKLLRGFHSASLRVPATLNASHEHVFRYLAGSRCVPQPELLMCSHDT